MRKKVLCLLLASLLLSATACENREAPLPEEPTENHSQIKTEEPTTALLGDVTVQPPSVTVVEKQSSDYVILADAQDAAAYAFAKQLQQQIFAASGALVSIENARLQYANAKKKILIGGCATPDTQEIAAATAAYSFTVEVAEGCIAFFAHDAIGYGAMEAYLTEEMLRSAEKGLWSCPLGVVSGTNNDAMTFRTDASELYRIVYSAKATNGRAFATLLSFYLKENCGLQTCVIPDTEPPRENEILLGNVQRDAAKRLLPYLSDGCYASVVAGGSYVLQSKSMLGIVFGVRRLVKSIEEAKKDQEAILDASCSIVENFEALPRDGEYAETVALANTFSFTYSSQQEELMAKADANVRADHALVTALVERLGSSLVLMNGRSSVLSNGWIKKLDPADYSRGMKVEGGRVLAPKPFLETYFETELPADGEGYVDLTAFCEGSGSYTLTYHAEHGLAVVTPQGERTFADPNEQVGGYTNFEYLQRMPRFFENPKLPEPQNNVEQTRSVVDQLDTDQEAKYIYDYRNACVKVLYSPAILAREEQGRTVIYAAYEYVTRYFKGTILDDPTYLQRSEDGGKTWEKVATLENARWVSLFELDGQLYMIGLQRWDGELLIGRYDPATRELERRAFMGVIPGGCAPNTVLIAKGRVYKAYNHCIASAPTDSDLLDPASWSYSNNPTPLLTREHYVAVTGKNVTAKKFLIEEGNVAMAPDGSLRVIYRIDANPTLGTVAMFTLTDDGKTVALDPACQGLVEFPYTQSKFSLRYDAELGLYLSLSSISTMNDRAQRNVLALVSSPDLIHWQIVDTVVIDRQILNDHYSMWAHGFQYVDFDVQGENLYFLVREAIGDTTWYHDANYITMYTISDFRNFVRSRLS